MDEDMYGGMGQDQGPSTDPEPQQPDEQKPEEMEGETALIPKTLLAGKKFDVGDEVVLEIVHDHGDEVEVKYAPEKPGGGEGEGGPEMAQADQKLASMAY